MIAARRLFGYANTAQGVAWGADLAVFAIPLGTAPEYFSPITLAGLKSEDPESAALYRHVLAWESEGRRLDFLNLSFGYSGLIDHYPEAGLRTNYGETIDVFAQADADEKTIFVWAAGNAHGTKCAQDAAYCVDGEVDASTVGILVGLPVYFEDLRGHNLAVVAVNQDGSITDFSNRCGNAADWCIAAPGDDILVAYFGPGRAGPGVRALASASGTSFAAPMVTGGLAVMKHLFRDQLPNTDLAARLLATADRSGQYADAAIYGQGLMDLGAATTPVGTTRIALAGTVDGAGAPVPATTLTSGGALGDELARSFAGQEIAAFDALGAPFWFDLGDFASMPDQPSASAQLRDFMAPTLGLHGLGARPVVSLRREHGAWIPRDEGPAGLQLGLLDTPAGTAGGHLGLAEHALTLSLNAPGGIAATAFSTEGVTGVAPAPGALVSCARTARDSAFGPVGLRVPRNEGVTNHVSPRAVRRSSRGVRRSVGSGSCGRAVEHRKGTCPGCRGFRIGRRQHRWPRYGERSASPAVSENPCTHESLSSGPGRPPPHLGLSAGVAKGRQNCRSRRRTGRRSQTRS